VEIFQADRESMMVVGMEMDNETKMFLVHLITKDFAVADTESNINELIPIILFILQSIMQHLLHEPERNSETKIIKKKKLLTQFIGKQ